MLMMCKCFLAGFCRSFLFAFAMFVRRCSYSRSISTSRSRIHKVAFIDRASAHVVCLPNRATKEGLELMVCTTVAHPPCCARMEHGNGAVQAI